MKEKGGNVIFERNRRGRGDEPGGHKRRSREISGAAGNWKRREESGAVAFPNRTGSPVFATMNSLSVQNGRSPRSHKNSMFSIRDDSPTRRFTPAAEPLLLVDSGAPVRRDSATPRASFGVVDVPPLDNVPTDSVATGLWESVRTYPPAVFFILGNEFCERFSFYGMRAVLTLYLITEHHLAESTASLCYHAFVSLAYFAPLLGSVAADNYFGRFRVILWVSLLYVFGHGLLSVGAIPQLDYGIRTFLDFGGLAVIALATGGIKPCVSAFAADQFADNQEEARSQFFSFFYFAINAGSLVAIIVTPLLRGRIRCFDSDYCFPLAFGVPGVLMLCAFLLFVAGVRFYKVTAPSKGNILWDVFKCIGHSLRRKLDARMAGRDDQPHWLDYAKPKFGENLVAGVKSLVAVAILFIPVTFFWALLDQQGSTWVLQARRMNGRVGPLTILPDQMTTANPLIILLMVPLFEGFIYPMARRLVIVTPLRKMAFGGILTALAFVMAGLLQLRVNETMEPRAAVGEGFIHRVGTLDGNLRTLNDNYTLDMGRNILPAGAYRFPQMTIQLAERKTMVLGIFGKNWKTFEYSDEKAENGKTRLYLIVDPKSSFIGQRIYILDSNNGVNAETTIRSGAVVDIQPALWSSPKYSVVWECSQRFNCSHRFEFFAEMGAVHLMDLSAEGKLETLVRPNSVHMFWQLPQFVLCALGEILFSVTGLEFSYSQASPSMKSVLQALWLMTTFFGNVIDMAISGSHIIKEPATEFFFYALLMLMVIGVFVLIAVNYEYVHEGEPLEPKKEEKE